MPVIFKCNCGQYLAVPNKYIGKKLQCKVCKAIIKVPFPENNDNKSEDNFSKENLKGKRCKECGFLLNSFDKKCPVCGVEISNN